MAVIRDTKLGDSVFSYIIQFIFQVFFLCTKSYSIWEKKMFLKREGRLCNLGRRWRDRHVPVPTSSGTPSSPPLSSSRPTHHASRHVPGWGKTKEAGTSDTLWPGGRKGTSQRNRSMKAMVAVLRAAPRPACTASRRPGQLGTNRPGTPWDRGLSVGLWSPREGGQEDCWDRMSHREPHRRPHGGSLFIPGGTQRKGSTGATRQGPFTTLPTSRGYC